MFRRLVGILIPGNYKLLNMFAYLSFFKKAAPKDSDSEEYSSHEEEETDEPLDIFNKPLAFQQWGTDTVVSYHFLSVRDVAPHLSSWCFNRKLDSSHKDGIKVALSNVESPHLMGAIQVIRDRNMKTRILNGQHRIKAIQELIMEDLEMHFQMRIMFEVYDIDIDDIDDLDSSHTLIEKMFKIANNSLNMAPEQDHDLYCKRLVMAMMNDPLLKKGDRRQNDGQREQATHLCQVPV